MVFFMTRFEEKIQEDKTASLFKHLKFLEPLNVYYFGPTRETAEKLATEYEEKSFSSLISTCERIASIADLAREELAKIYFDRRTTPNVQESIWRTVGKKRIEEIRESLKNRKISLEAERNSFDVLEYEFSLNPRPREYSLFFRTRSHGRYGSTKWFEVDMQEVPDNALEEMAYRAVAIFEGNPLEPIEQVIKRILKTSK
jgi:hypothetical protein